MEAGNGLSGVFDAVVDSNLPRRLTGRQLSTISNVWQDAPQRLWRGLSWTEHGQRGSKHDRAHVGVIRAVLLTGMVLFCPDEVITRIIPRRTEVPYERVQPDVTARKDRMV